jgi:hypothetical protein
MSASLLDMLEDLHDVGITVVLMYGHRDQFARLGGNDLRSQVDSNTGWSIDFDASSKETLQWIQDHSPTGMRIHRSWSRPNASIDDINDPDEYGLPRAQETAEKVSFIEHEGPIYSKGEILELNATGRVAWLRARVNNDLRATGVVPFYWQHMHTEDEYRILTRAPYPGPGASTITVRRDPFRNAVKPIDLSSPITPKPKKGE